VTFVRFVVKDCFPLVAAMPRYVLCASFLRSFGLASPRWLDVHHSKIMLVKVTADPVSGVNA
jgi:hypothetical protein